MGAEEAGRAPRRSPGRWRPREDQVVAAVIVLASAVVIALTTTFEEVPAALSQGIPPEQFPRLVLGVIIALALILALQARRAAPARRARVPAMIYLSAGLLIALVVALEYLGAFAAMALFCIARPLLWGERRLVALAIYAVAVPSAVYLLFTRILEVRFPGGILASWWG